MSQKKEFNLPKGSYAVLSQILQAYFKCGDGKVPLKNVASKSGLHKNTVSENNPFLVSIRVLDIGRDKSLTDIGKKLAMAVGNQLEDDISSEWRNVLVQCQATKEIMDMITIQKSIKKEDFSSKIASTLGIVKSKETSAGINRLIELFEKAELIELVDGRYQAKDKGIFVKENGTQDEVVKDGKTNSAPLLIQAQSNLNHNIAGGISPTLYIDLQIHISPETSPDQIDKIFESIAKHLFKQSQIGAN